MTKDNSNSTSAPPPLRTESMRDVANTTERLYTESVSYIVATLRSLADEIERAGSRTSSPLDGTPQFGKAASRVVHAVSWGVANATMSDVVTKAAQADLAHTALQIRLDEEAASE